MQPARTYLFMTPVAGLLGVALVGVGSLAQAPGVGGTGFVLVRTTVLALAAAQALRQCWISAAYWMVPASQRPRGWSQTELVLMVSTAVLAAAVMGAALQALAQRQLADLTEAAALCGAWSVAFCALAYAGGRSLLLVRRRLKRRRHPMGRVAAAASRVAPH